MRPEALEAELAGSAAGSADTHTGAATGSLPSAAAGATSEPLIITTKDDNPATASPANDNEPAVTVSAEAAGAATAGGGNAGAPGGVPATGDADTTLTEDSDNSVADDLPIAEPANDNPPPAELPATGTE